jgi:hypothetical protein
MGDDGRGCYVFQRALAIFDLDHDLQPRRAATDAQHDQQVARLVVAHWGVGHEVGGVVQVPAQGGQVVVEILLMLSWSKRREQIGTRASHLDHAKDGQGGFRSDGLLVVLPILANLSASPSLAIPA